MYCSAPLWCLDNGTVRTMLMPHTYEVRHVTTKGARNTRHRVRNSRHPNWGDPLAHLDAVKTIRWLLFGIPIVLIAAVACAYACADRPLMTARW